MVCFVFYLTFSGIKYLFVRFYQVSFVYFHVLKFSGANPHAQDNWGKNALEVSNDHGEKATLHAIKDFLDGKKHLTQKVNTSTQEVPTPPIVKSGNRVLSKLFEAPLNEEQALKW